MDACYLGCIIIIFINCDQMEYFQFNAFYCCPKDINSIRLAVDRAYSAKSNIKLKEKILSEYNWDVTAQKTIKAYEEVLKIS